MTNYQLVVTNNGVARTLTYDLNGNLTTNATSTATNTFEWDAENRLTAVNEAGTNRSEFGYDGHRQARADCGEDKRGCVHDQTICVVWN